MKEETNNQRVDSEGGRLTKAERKKRRREEKQREREQQQRRRQKIRAARWVVVAAGVVIVVGGIILGVGRSEQKSEQSGLAQVGEMESDWTKGSPDASAVLVEYGDFQCPACAAFYPIVNGISDELGDRLLVVYRHFPLRKIHPQAQLAAQAAEAAGRQEKFWKMHDVLFERQDEWADNRGARDVFLRYAEEMGLDRERFEADLDDKAIKDKINEDLRSGSALGITGTPTFFLNGEELQGYNTYDDFKQRIREAAGEGS